MSREAPTRRPFWVDVTLLVCAGAVFMTLVGLGNWQIARLAWKNDLIASVEARAFSAPVPPPTDDVTADAHTYLRVFAEGTYRHALTQRVKALTELGGGHWVMTPLSTAQGYLWVNRGFVPSGLDANLITAPLEKLTVEGLLRITEEGGTLLEANDPGAQRWVSRDIEALSQAVGIGPTLPYFVDADHIGNAGDWPRGGLTQVQFRNKHLSYALTWYAMAGLFLGAMGYVVYARFRGIDLDEA